MDLACSNAFLFSVQRAMPEEVSPSLSGVAVDADEKTLYVRCLYDGPVGESEQEFMSYMQEAVWADFFPTIRVEVEAQDAKLADVVPMGSWAFRRGVRELARA